MQTRKSALSKEDRWVRHARTAENGRNHVNDILKIYTPNKKITSSNLKIRTAASDALFSGSVVIEHGICGNMDPFP